MNWCKNCKYYDRISDNRSYCKYFEEFIINSKLIVSKCSRYRLDEEKYKRLINSMIEHNIDVTDQSILKVMINHTRRV